MQYAYIQVFCYKITKIGLSKKIGEPLLYALFVWCYSTKFRRYRQIFEIIMSIIIDKSKVIVYNSEY